MAATSLAADTGMALPLETGLATCLVAVELGRRLGLDETFEAGDTIVVEGIFSGTQTGPLVGARARSRRPETRSPSPPWTSCRSGTASVCHRIYWDNVTFLAQIGAIPAQ